MHTVQIFIASVQARSLNKTCNIAAEITASKGINRDRKSFYTFGVDSN